MEKLFVTLAIGTILFLSCRQLNAQGLLDTGRELKIQRFHTRGLDKDGGNGWTLDGRAADLRGNVTELSGFTATISNKDGIEYSLSSPKCRFMHSLKEVKSDAPLTLSSKGVLASGIGYDIFLDSKLVRIRSTVKVVIQRGKFSEKLTINPNGKNNDK